MRVSAQVWWQWAPQRVARVARVSLRRQRGVWTACSLSGTAAVAAAAAVVGVARQSLAP
jgi:hypothetical protein